MKDESITRGDSGPGVGAEVRKQESSGTRAGRDAARGGGDVGGLLAGANGAAERSAAPAKLTEGERRAFRMGALAAGAIFIPACESPCGCRARVENLRIAIAARGVECDAPSHWPEWGTK